MKAHTQKVSSLFDIPAERAAEGLPILTAALHALALAKDKREAIEILRQAARLVPELFTTPETRAAIVVGAEMGRRLRTQAAGQTTCVDCGVPIARSGERGVLPERCADCQGKRRRAQQAEYARKYRRAKAAA